MAVVGGGGGGHRVGQEPECVGMVLGFREAEVVLDDARSALLLLVGHGLPRIRREDVQHGIARLCNVRREEASDACKPNSLLQALLNVELLAVGTHGVVVRQPRQGSGGVAGHGVRLSLAQNGWTEDEKFRRGDRQGTARHKTKGLGSAKRRAALPESRSTTKRATCGWSRNVLAQSDAESHLHRHRLDTSLGAPRGVLYHRCQ